MSTTHIVQFARTGPPAIHPKGQGDRGALTHRYSSLLRGRLCTLHIHTPLLRVENSDRGLSKRGPVHIPPSNCRRITVLRMFAQNNTIRSICALLCNCSMLWALMGTWYLASQPGDPWRILPDLPDKNQENWVSGWVRTNQRLRHPLIYDLAERFLSDWQKGECYPQIFIIFGSGGKRIEGYNKV